MERRGRIRPTLVSGREFVKAKFKNRMFLIPSLVTVIAFFSGFLGSIAAVKGNYNQAAVCVFVALVFDGLDGRVARRLNATSAFGREFDSLSDVVAFGVTPAILIYQWAFSVLADEFGILICFLFVVCGGARLARFNIVETGELKTELKKSFQGLPIPGAAFALVSLVYLHPEPLNNQTIAAVTAAYTGILAILMVSSLPFFSLKTIKLDSRATVTNLIALSLTVALIWYHNRFGIFLVANIYALSGLAMWVWRKKKKTAEVASAA